MSGDIVNSAQVRRGALFLINIGVPVIVGTVRHQPDGALIGAVVGMLLAFADNDGELLSRLRLLTLNAVMIAGCGITGYLCQNSPLIFWLVFVAITLCVGLAAHGGREMLLTARHGAIAFTIAADTPAFEVHQIWYVVGVAALSAASRALDHLLAGPVPLQPGAPLQKPRGHSGWLRFALAFSGAAVASMWIGRTLDQVRTIWIVTTTILVMLPDARASYRRIFERVSGTFAGVVAAWLITTLFHSATVICIAILAVAPLIPHHHANRYWLHTGLIGLMVMLAYDLTLLDSQGIITNLLMQRLQDIGLGCAMGLIGTAAAFPHKATAGVSHPVGDSRKGQ